MKMNALISQRFTSLQRIAVANPCIMALQSKGSFHRLARATYSAPVSQNGCLNHQQQVRRRSNGGSKGNPSAIVTGGAKGLGACIAERLVKEGYHVVISDVDEESGRALQAKLGSDATFAKVDTTDAKQVEDVVHETVKSRGHLSLMVNNAGIVGAQETAAGDYPLDIWHQVLAVNLNGVFYGCKYALSVMKDQRYGNVINMASTAGLTGLGGLSPYTAAKGAVVSLTRSLALEYGRYGIRVNALAPGATLTPMVEQFIASSADPQAITDVMSSNNIVGKDLIRPDDIADTLTWLISPRARVITGQTVPVDAGLLFVAPGAKQAVESWGEK